MAPGAAPVTRGGSSGLGAAVATGVCATTRTGSATETIAASAAAVVLTMPTV